MVVIRAATHALRRGTVRWLSRRWARVRALAYRVVLAKNPGRSHIWVRLGRTLEKTAAFDDALLAYLNASLLDHGHGQGPSALVQLVTRMGRTIEPSTMATLRSSAARLVEDWLVEGSPERSEPGGAMLVFDVSDLVRYWADRRLPTGIQRVQMELILGMLDLPEQRRIGICSFFDCMNAWFNIDPALFRRFASLSRSSSDVDWQTQYAKLVLRLVLAEPFVFPPAATLVNLGTSWWLPNYFTHVRRLRLSGVRYVPFVHDLIPIVAPEHCLDELKVAFRRWLEGVFECADHFLVNSEATRRDLVRVARELGHPVQPERIAVLRLDASIPCDDPAEHSPIAQPYVLLVSTVESRKGHLVALDAWRRLIAKHGEARMPRLLFLGRRGWLSDAVYQRIEDHPELARTVTILSDTSDDVLAALYRDCLFTLYPSFYEGWGLPVTEALASGAAVIASLTSSLPEAGGDLAIYVTPGSVDELAAAVEHLTFEPGALEAAKARINAEFRRRTWKDVAAELDQKLALAGSLIGSEAEQPEKQVGDVRPIG